MKIYINGRFLTQRITGVQRYAIEISKALDKLILINNKLRKNSYEILVPSNFRKNVSFENIKVNRVGKLSGHLWEQIELPFYSRKGVLVNFCACAPLIKRKQVVTIHDAAMSAIPESFTFSFRIWYKIMSYILGHRLDTIYTVSEFSRRELHKYFSIDLKKIIVTYNGVDHIKKMFIDENIFHKHGIKKSEYILAVSSMNPSKNFKLILQAAQNEKLKDKKFIIVGGTYTKIFGKIDIKIPNNVKFIGYVSDEELVALYRNAACFVYPSLYEGFGIPPVEAMACGCPVIVSNRGSLPEICGDGALYCDAYNSEDLADKIDSLLSNEPLRAELIPKAYNVAEKYTWESVARKIIAQEW